MSRFANQPSVLMSRTAAMAVFAGLVLANVKTSGQQPNVTNPTQPAAKTDARFGAFSPVAFLKASRPFSPDGAEEAKKSWLPIEPDTDGQPTVLKCTGSPTGYLRTRKTYSDFRVSFQWRYPDNVNGNSGVLVHTTGPDKIWPRSIQVQLHAPKAGSVLIHDGANTDNMVSVSGLVKDSRAWNTCVITCRDDTLTVEINGKKAGTVTGCVPNSGQLALQSEGSEVWFRNIRVESVPTGKSDTKRR